MLQLQLTALGARDLAQFESTTLDDQGPLESFESDFRESDLGRGCRQIQPSSSGRLGYLQDGRALSGRQPEPRGLPHITDRPQQPGPVEGHAEP